MLITDREAPEEIVERFTAQGVEVQRVDRPARRALPATPPERATTRCPPTTAGRRVDHVKLDGCNVPTEAGRTMEQSHHDTYAAWSQAMPDTGRPMAFSVSAPRTALAS